jgi:AmiR/NasT family two-component response regulator
VRSKKQLTSAAAGPGDDEQPCDEYVAVVAPLAAVPDTPAEPGTNVVLVDVRNGELMRKALESGIEPALMSSESLDSAVGLALEQVVELQKLRATYGRLRLLERAKGILMERHRVSERTAYELLHRQARNSNLRLSEVAQAVVESHLLLPAPDLPSPARL